MEIPIGLNWLGIGSNGVDILNTRLRHEIFNKKKFIRVNFEDPKL
jgi:hypothetical protein